jgi:hypothetical protein
MHLLSAASRPPTFTITSVVRSDPFIMAASAPASPLDDSDPTYTHFAHREQFLELLDRFCRYCVEEKTTAKEDEVEEALVSEMGAIVSISCSISCNHAIDKSVICLSLVP